MTPLHDEICLTRVGRKCNCPGAAWNLDAQRLYHTEAAGYRGTSLKWLHRRAVARQWLQRAFSIWQRVFSK